jgi:membrane protease YdiL (CAAX protease family)
VQTWLFSIGLALLMAFVATGTIRSGRLLRDWTPPHNLLLSWPDNLLRLALVGLCLALGLGLGPGPEALVLAHLGTDILVGLIAGTLLAVLLGLTGALAVRRWGMEIYSNRMVQVILPINRREWLGVLPALLLAAALEELLFRWLPLAGLAPVIPPQWLLWPLALFFGALHWPQGWWGVAGTTIAALYLALLFLLTGSIWPPLVAHYVMNVSQLVLAQRSGLRPLRAGN